MTPLTTATRAVLYTRISLDQTGEGLGVARQRDALRGIADSRGWTITEDLSDNDLSAAGKVRRPGFERLLELIATGLVDVVLAYAMDRITRNSRDAVRFLEAAQQAKVRVVLVNGGELDLASPMGQFAAEMSAGIAKLEIATKAERQRLANQQRAVRGVPVVVKRLFGYTHDRTALVTDEAEAVRSVFSDLLAGASVRSIAARLNAEGFTTPLPKPRDDDQPPAKRGGKPWTAEGVRQIAKNATYAGLRVYGGSEYPGTWPAIVERDTWAAACRLLADPERWHGLSLARRWLGSNLYRCGVCEEAGTESLLISTYRSRPSGPVRIYRCQKAAHLSVRAEPVDEFVSSVVVARLSRPDASALLIDNTAPDVDEIRQRAETIRARITDLGDLFEEGDLSKAEYQTRKHRLAERLAEAEAAMMDATRVPVLADLVSAEDVAGRWDTLDLDRQRAVVDTLATVTIVSPGVGRRSFDPDCVQIAPR